MLLKISASTAGVCFAASVVVCVGVGPAAAANRHQDAASAAHRIQDARSADQWHHRPYFVHRAAMPRYDYNHPDESAPGYVFVPGRGILNESCDLPTSTCSNEYRDIE